MLDDRDFLKMLSQAMARGVSQAFAEREVRRQLACVCVACAEKEAA